jgi:hypothetical protein
MQRTSRISTVSCARPTKGDTNITTRDVIQSCTDEIYMPLASKVFDAGFRDVNNLVVLLIQRSCLY